MVLFFSSIYKPVNSIDAKNSPIINIYQSAKINEMNVLVTQAIWVLKHLRHSHTVILNTSYLAKRYFVSVKKYPRK